MEMSIKDQKRIGHQDLESLEFHIRGSMHEIGKKLLESILNAEGKTKSEKVDKRFKELSKYNFCIRTMKMSGCPFRR